MKDATTRQHAYEERKAQLQEQMRSVGKGETVALGKDTSNLFRDYGPGATKKLNVRDFNHVLEVNTSEGWIEVEGMTQYYDLVQEALKFNVMPTVVPQLRSITIGGAVSGVGIESSSFKYGLVHETVQALEILLPSGEVVLATPENEYKDLFFGFPNSYGTLGYALKVRVKAVPVKKYVHLQHIRYTSYEEVEKGIQEWCVKEDVDFVDGSVFSSKEMYLTIGRFTDSAPHTSDYTYENIYYKSIQTRKEDYLTTHDYIWRWDTDWFWCSKAMGMQNSIVRRIMGRKRLNSITYTKIMRWNSKWKLGSLLNKLLGYSSESVIQDIDVPVWNLPPYLHFFEKEIGISPVWLCPTKRYNSSVKFTLFSMKPDTLYVNVGFWDVVRSRVKHPDGYYNKKVEQKVEELGGVKSLYSSVYYDEDTFWRLYNGEAYKQLKHKYDPDKKKRTLYEVVAGRVTS